MFLLVCVYVCTCIHIGSYTHPCVHLAQSTLHCYTDHASRGQVFDSHTYAHQTQHTVTDYKHCLSFLAALHNFRSTHRHTHTHMHAHTHTHTRTHACTQTHTHTCMHTNTHTHTHTHTHSHARTHAHTHTHTHTHTHACNGSEVQYPKIKKLSLPK